MKIFVTGTRGIPNIMGGVETHCEELFPRIVRLDGDVTVIRRSNYINDDLKTWKDVKLVNIESPKKKSFEAIIHTFRAINYAKSHDAEILHVNAIGPALLVPYAKLLGLKVVFTHHGSDYDRDKWGFAAKTILKLGERMGCMFADDVIVISSVIKDLISKKYNRTKNVHLIYNGVPQPDICHYTEYFNELGIHEGKYVLGMCRFVPEKNLHHLVEAYIKLKSQSNSSDFPKLVLAGDTDFEDDYSRSLKKLAKDNDIVLTGFVKGKKLHSLLTNAQCYVLPSSHEGLPIALLEAMSYRLPVVVSDIPANKEIGLPDQCYFECGNINQLADKINFIIHTPLYRVDYDMTKYNWDDIANQTMEVYNSVITLK